MNIFLQVGDLTGFSFFLASMALLAATVFFLLERGSVSSKWKLSLTLTTLITGIAAVHYHYMTHAWILSSASPTEIRYLDWLLTVPLMCIGFYVILQAIGHASRHILYRLFGYSVGMLVFGYLGETLLLDPMIAFGIGIILYGLILYEIFKGDTAKAMELSSHFKLKSSFKILRLFVLIGFAIYPLGYYISVLSGVEITTVVYNLTDVINKIGFSLVIYLLARSDSHIG
ncbi:biphenyl 2,3-dioxygenase [Candidatus Marinamargulisbacteria bacterium SCGC AG-343-K17]|nr:biphenyl 2,3-dioxygenase [Candidatus Marinamargulisbacteria bacterium SCGC AG-343-K17]